MSRNKTDVLGNLVYASVSMSCASEIPGYNGSLFAISDVTKERIESDLTQARDAVAELINAAKQAKRAYWLARDSAAGLTNFCEESPSSRRCERELSAAESLWRSAGLDAALARIGGPV